MYSIEKQQDWVRFRRRLDREIRVLIIEINPKLRKDLENLLYRCRLSARAVPSEGQARKLISSGHFSLVVVPEVIPGKNGTALINALQAEFPDLDFILTTKSPSLELVSWAFDLEVRDIVRRPVLDTDDVMDQFKQAALRNTERRIRQHLIKELKALYEAKVAARFPTLGDLLEDRLAAYKEQLGKGNRILVVETCNELRSFSESLFIAGFEVETVSELDAALLRIPRGDINMMVLRTAEEPGEVAGLMESIKEADPFLVTVLIAPDPNVSAALQALRLGAALHLPMLPDEHGLLVDRISDILYRDRRKRLLDNLLVELYMIVVKALSDSIQDQDLDLLEELCGLTPNIRMNYALSRTKGPRDTLVESTSYLDDVIEEMLPGTKQDDTAVEYQRITGADLAVRSRDRRVHNRLADDHFIRCRQTTSPSSVLAYLGNLSEGGLFVRTPQLLKPGAEVDLDFNLELDEQWFQVCCPAEVVWMAQDDKEFELGPGFGVRFVDAPDEVVEMVQQVIGQQDDPE